MKRKMTEENIKRLKNLHEGNKTHGNTEKRAYSIWCGMKQRCLNPNSQSFKNYGGRGITICDRWVNSFEHFFADMGEPSEGLTIDRIDNDKGYSPDNCEWVSRAHQMSNRRCNRFITHNGITQTAMAWSNQLGIAHQTIYGRLDLGLSTDMVLSPEKHTNLTGLSLGGLANGARNRAKTHCKFGHEFSGKNLRILKNGGRECKRCKADREAVRQAKIRAKQ